MNLSMRERLLKIWRKLTQIKILTPIIIFIRWFAATDFFNTILDFMEKHIFHTSFEESRSFYAKNRERIENIAANLADEKSRRVYKNILAYRATHDRRYLHRKIVDREQYFDEDIVDLTENEYFVDCGAYKADTIKAFLQKLGENRTSAYVLAFEPDAYNFGCLKKQLRKLGISGRVRCVQLGTWSSAKELRFRANTEEGCMIMDDGDSVIQVNSIDNVVNLHRHVTFIKMDVEGAEYDSLIGAKHTIEKWHPRLAISIYHSDEDMVRIAEYLMREYPFYKFYIRHYTWFYADTVLYAVAEDE